MNEGDDIFIRRARGLDAKNIIKCRVRSIKEVCSKDYPAHQIKAWSGCDFQEEIWQKTINTDHVWVLDNGEEILGFGYMKFYNENSAEIKGLYFSPEAIGKGFGRKLVDVMKNFAVSKNRNHFTLSATITAKGFYEKIGFTQTGEMRNVTICGEAVGCFPMELKL